MKEPAGSTGGGPKKRVSANVRVPIAGAFGLVIGCVLAFIAPWQIAVLLGWNAAGLAYVAWVWWTVRRMEPVHARTHATAIDESTSTANVVLILACIASLLGVGLELLRVSGLHGASRAWGTFVAVATVAMSWTVVHVVFMLRYADVYYRVDRGIDFHQDTEADEDEGPDYKDFAYVAFTIGMTYQVSDTDLTSKDIRRLATRHALLSFVFGTAIIAITINIVAGLLNR